AAGFAAGNAAAPRAEVAHQVPGILIRRVDFDVHDGFEERGARLLHGFLEREGAGNLEGDVRRNHIVVFAVVENGTEIRDREPSEIAARRGNANSLLDGRNPVCRDGAAENVVDEFDALAALDGLHLDAAHTELPVPAGLLLVLAFGVGLSADGFAIRNFRRLKREIDVVALLELGDDNFDVLLAGAGEQKFLSLRVAGEAQGAVFLENFMDAHANLVFV